MCARCRVCSGLQADLRCTHCAGWTPEQWERLASLQPATTYGRGLCTLLRELAGPNPLATPMKVVFPPVSGVFGIMPSGLQFLPSTASASADKMCIAPVGPPVLSFQPAVLPVVDRENSAVLAPAGVDRDRAMIDRDRELQARALHADALRGP